MYTDHRLNSQLLSAWLHCIKFEILKFVAPSAHVGWLLNLDNLQTLWFLDCSSALNLNYVGDWLLDSIEGPWAWELWGAVVHRNMFSTKHWEFC